jgi:quercetin dioxygenase-like cupin family protein
VELTVGSRRYRLEPQDAVLFDADVHHGCRNTGDSDATVYVVLNQTDTAS